MSRKATEKVMEALTQLLEGYTELQEAFEDEDLESAAEDDDDDDDLGAADKVESGVVSELKIAIEAVMDGEDYSPETIAEVITSLTSALEEIDPDLFEDDDEDDDDDDEPVAIAETDIDDDDLDYDEDDEEDEDDDEDDDDDEEVEEEDEE